jgi:hypothetical protein
MPLDADLYILTIRLLYMFHEHFTLTVLCLHHSASDAHGSIGNSLHQSFKFVHTPGQKEVIIDIISRFTRLYTNYCNDEYKVLTEMAMGYHSGCLSTFHKNILPPYSG